MSRAEMERALKRPLDYNQLHPRTQWSVDERLGILDWSPDQAEVAEYLKLRAAMGDKACQKYLEKKVDNA